MRQVIIYNYLDANNHNGLAMRQKLPSHGFVWNKFDDFTSGKIDQLMKKDKYKQGHILEVDEEYPKELQKKHNQNRKGGKLVLNLKDK